MNIRFTNHARDKFKVLRVHGVLVTKSQVMHVIRRPDAIDSQRLPLLIAQGNFDKSRILRVVYRNEGDTVVVITFYPGRKSQYEKK